MGTEVVLTQSSGKPNLARLESLLLLFPAAFLLFLLDNIRFVGEHDGVTVGVHSLVHDGRCLNYYAVRWHLE